MFFSSKRLVRDPYSLSTYEAEQPIRLDDARLDAWALSLGQRREAYQPKRNPHRGMLPDGSGREQAGLGGAGVQPACGQAAGRGSASRHVWRNDRPGRGSRRERAEALCLAGRSGRLRAGEERTERAGHKIQWEPGRLTGPAPCSKLERPLHVPLV